MAFAMAIRTKKRGKGIHGGGRLAPKEDKEIK